MISTLPFLPTLSLQSLHRAARLDGVCLMFQQGGRTAPAVMRPHAPDRVYEAEQDTLFVSAVDEPRPLTATSRTGHTQLVSAGVGGIAEPPDSTHHIGAWWHPKTKRRSQRAAGGPYCGLERPRQLSRREPIGHLGLDIYTLHYAIQLPLTTWLISLFHLPIHYSLSLCGMGVTFCGRNSFFSQPSCQNKSNRPVV